MKLLGLFLGMLVMIAADAIGQHEVKVDTVATEKPNDIAVQEENPQSGTKSQKTGFRCSFLILNNLAKAAQIIDESEAFDCLNSLLVYEEIRLQKRQEIFKETIATATASTATSLSPKSIQNLHFGAEIAVFGKF